MDLVEVIQLLFSDRTFEYGALDRGIERKIAHLGPPRRIDPTTRCSHYMGYSFGLAVWFFSYAALNTQDSTPHNICCTRCGELAESR